MSDLESCANDADEDPGAVTLRGMWFGAGGASGGSIKVERIVSLLCKRNNTVGGRYENACPSTLRPSAIKLAVNEKGELECLSFP